MRVVVPLPAVDFYLWQAVVQSFALKRLGWDVTYLVYYTTAKPPPRLVRLSAIADVEMWRDWRTTEQHGYNPAMKPWLVGKWLERHPEFADEPCLLMDPDVIPTGATEMPVPTATGWWGTDTDSYTGPGYLQSKGDGLWRGLCGIVGVDPEVAVLHPGVGAQYTFVGQSADFWETVALKSVEAYRWMVNTAREYTPRNPDGTVGLPVQAWCSEMYVMQLEMIRRGITIGARPEMEMAWEDGPVADWGRVGFFHDAGCVDPAEGRFHKQTYQVSPWGRRIPPVNPGAMSYRYVQLIREVGREHPKLTWR